jgi:L-threonylcarbamoyladenylate synthase
MPPPPAASGPSPVAVDPVRPDPDTIADAARALDDGGLVAFPTETVYGLGASVRRPEAVARIFAAKGRPATDPLIVHVADLAAATGVVSAVPAPARALADAFWPGPLTIVLPRGPLVGDGITAGGASVGVRVPAHPVALALLAAAADPVAAPSANRFGRISPTTADHVVAELGDRMDPVRDRILDGGPTPLGIESTVVDLTDTARSGARPRVLRHGGVPWEDLVAVIGPVDQVEREVADEADPASAPGRFLRHYAPATPLVLVEGDDLVVAELVDRLAARGVRVHAVLLPRDPVDAARRLYADLRAADASGAQALLVTPVPPHGLGRAVNDRLFRAAHGRVVTSADDRDVDRVAAAARP